MSFVFTVDDKFRRDDEQTGSAYLLLSRLNAMRTRAVYAPFFPTIVRYEDNRLGSGLPYFLSSLHDRSMTVLHADRIRTNRVSRCS